GTAIVAGQLAINKHRDIRFQGAWAVTVRRDQPGRSREDKTPLFWLEILRLVLIELNRCFSRTGMKRHGQAAKCHTSAGGEQKSSATWRGRVGHLGFLHQGLTIK